MTAPRRWPSGTRRWSTNRRAMPDDVWILGASMIKFGRYPDKDVMDIGSEAAMSALSDAGASMADLDILAVGNQFEPLGGVGQQLQRQIGQTGIPVYNVTNACATGASAMRIVSMAIKAGEAEMGLAVGAEKMGKARLGGGGATAGKAVYE